MAPYSSPSRYILTPIWVLLHLLLIDIDNQSISIDEDKFNKPWRPLPSGRVTQISAINIARALYPTCIILSLLIGGHQLVLSSICFAILVFIYNHLRLNGHWFWKNAINTCGYLALECGASLILGENFLLPTAISALNIDLK